MVSTRSPSREGEPNCSASSRSPPRPCFNPLPLSRRGAPALVSGSNQSVGTFQPAPPLAKGSPSSRGARRSPRSSRFNPLPLSRRGALAHRLSLPAVHRVSTRSPSREGEPRSKPPSTTTSWSGFNPLPLSRRGARVGEVRREAEPLLGFQPAPPLAKGSPWTATRIPTSTRRFNPLPLSRRGARCAARKARKAIPGFNPLPLSRRGALGTERTDGPTQLVSTRSPSREGEPVSIACAPSSPSLFQPAPPLAKGSPAHEGVRLHSRCLVSTRSPSREGEPLGAGYREAQCRTSFNPLPLSRRGALAALVPPVDSRPRVSTRSPSREGEPALDMSPVTIADMFQPAPPLAKGSPPRRGSRRSSKRSGFNPLPLSRRGARGRRRRRKPTPRSFQPAPPLAKGSPTRASMTRPSGATFQPAPPLAKGSPDPA